MTATDNSNGPSNDDRGLRSAWTDWSEALVATLFPAGLGAGQHFSFGQTTLAVDLVNHDPAVINAELFRIADTVPQDSPDFVNMGSLSEAYGYFLQSVGAPALSSALSNWQLANNAVANRFTMPVKQGTRPPPGASATGPGGLAQEAATFLPAYSLDASFQSKYDDWQRSSIANRTSDGGVIRIGPTAARAPRIRSLLAAHTQEPASDTLPPFLRLQRPAPSLSTSATPSTSSAPALRGLMRGVQESPALGTAAANAPPVLDGYAIEVAFTGLATFMLGPTQWFSDTAVRLFAHQLPEGEQDNYFGRQGVLARRVYQIVLGFQPSVTLRFDARHAAGASAVMSQPPGSAIGVGPMSISGGALSTSTDGAGSIVRIVPPPSRLPILLGVVSTQLIHPPPGPKWRIIRRHLRKLLVASDAVHVGRGR